MENQEAGQLLINLIERETGPHSGKIPMTLSLSIRNVSAMLSNTYLIKKWLTNLLSDGAVTFR